MAKIMIVEDDALISQLYQTAFKFDGYDVEVAGDGQEGLDKIKVRPPDVILLDVMMPHMNGLDMLDQLKADPNLKQIPVIMLTNLDKPHEAQAALDKGAVKYIVKAHHDPKQITDMVKEVIAAYVHQDNHPRSAESQTGNK